MFIIPCRCGKSEKNFRMNIGPFFIGDCCEEVGYDSLGNKKEVGMSSQELQELVSGVSEELELRDIEVKVEEVQPAIKPVKPRKPSKVQG